MNFRLTIALLVCWGLAFLAGAQQTNYCAICNRPLINEQSYVFEDQSVGGKVRVCTDCEKLTARCFLCGLPVLTNYVTLPDGRYECERDYREAIHDEDEAKQVFADVQDEMSRTFSRFMSFPSQNVVFNVVDKFQLESLFKSTGYEHCVSIFGATQSHALGEETNYVHSISVLSDLKKPRLMAVCAHEYTHTWINENVKKRRKAVIDSEAVEGFCEFMAYKLMESHGETFEMETIKKNSYTKGQILLMLEVERRYGFDAILDWMKAGEDAKLDADHLDRVRFVESDLVTSPPGPPAWVAPPGAAAPAPVFRALTLKGILGTPQHRFALINNGTFDVMEEGRVRLGETNVTIRCLEIRDDSVVVQQAGSNVRQELFLRNR